MTPEEQKLMDESFTHVDLESKDLVAERIEQLKALFPEIAVEGDGSIDFEKLRLILGDEVDEGQERYAFTWPGKTDAIRQAQTPSTATLRPDEAASVDWDTTENLYIEGDNLEVLKLLQRGYHGKVKMIYIDPPYNTGHDFVYKDSFQDSIENYKDQAGLSGQSNADTSGRYHSDWLSMMYPRLRLARELLSEDGIIAISIDDNELNSLRFICDEILGSPNFIDTIIWKKRYGGGPKEKYLVTLQDYVLIYAKDISMIQDITVPLTEESIQRYYTKQDSNFDKRGPYRTHPLEANKTLDARENLVFPIVAPDGTEVWPKRQWLWSKERVREALDNNEIEFAKSNDGGWSVQTKQYLKLEDGSIRRGKLQSIIDDVYTQHGTNEILDIFGDAKIFSYPKPTQFLIKLFDMIPDTSALFLDFFSGSASSMDALMKMNLHDGGTRKAICIQLPECSFGNKKAEELGLSNLCEIAEERLRRVGKQIEAEVHASNAQLTLSGESTRMPDIGFRILKLDSSNFDKVEGGALVDNLIKPGRTYDDIIFEMMLKWGLELSLPMEKTEVAGYPITSIAADELICCMDEGLTVEVLEAIAALEPKRVFFLDSVLSDTIKLNAAQIFKRVGNKLGYEIELRTA